MSSFDSGNVSESNQHQQKTNLAKTATVVKVESAEDTAASNFNRTQEKLDENERVIITYKHRVVDEQCPIGDNKKKVDNDGDLEGGNCAITGSKDANKIERDNDVYQNVNIIGKGPDKDFRTDENPSLELSEKIRLGVPICGNGDNPNLIEAQLPIDCPPTTISIREGKLLLAGDNLSVESSTDEKQYVAAENKNFTELDTVNTKSIGGGAVFKCELNKSVTLMKTSSHTSTSLTPTMLPPLPTSNKFNISHTSSDPSFGLKLRQTRQHNVVNENSPNWRPDTSGPYSSVVKSGTMSESASPNLTRKTSVSTVSLPRRVSFPKSDNELVTGYLEPANPWEHVCMVKSISEIAELYVTSCQKHNTKPLQCVLEHLKGVDLQNQLRQPLLSLKSVKLRPSDCEALEEVFKRVQYKSIDLSNCELDETAASAIFEMIEYYEATNELDISSNPSGMTHRGWVSCNYMIGHSQELQVLNAEGNPISKMSADNLGSALSTSNLHTLKLEHCGLRGSPLSNLSFKLRHNRTLKELWLGYNDLDCNDADAIAELLKVNHYLELIDVSNNNMRDEGLRHIVMALIMQSKELERRSTFKRTAAIDDDDSALQTEPLFQDDLKSCKNEWKSNDRMSREISSPEPLETRDEKDEDNYVSSIESEIQGSQSDVRTGGGDCDMRTNEREFLDNPSILEEIDGDEDTEDTIRSSTVKNSSQNSGQSMLDKLLSMNSESSSEDGTSNLSTDTLAACCSEDTSLISDDILDATTNTSTSNTNANIKAQTLEENNAAPFSIQPTGASCPNLIQSSSMVLLDASGDYKSRRDDDSSISVTLGPPTVDTISESQNNNLTNNSTSPRNNRLNNNIVAASDQSEIFEVAAEEGYCIHSSAADVSSKEHQSLMQHHSASKALDVNKNTKIIEDFDDTHSTDSAFESASEGDISRHLPEDFTRLSTSLESSRLDDLGKEPAIETATIASESNECLIAAAVSATTACTLTPFTPPFARIQKQLAECERCVNMPASNSCLSTSLPDTTTATPTVKLNFGSLEETTNMSVEPIRGNKENIPKVTISEDNMTLKTKSIGGIMPTCSPTPPPPSTSPGGSSSGLRRTESSCAFLTQSSRTCSQSTDSLSSENSLDGSIGSGDINFSSSTQLNEKLTKNDTLTRQQRQMDVLTESTHRAPNGLKALSIWNNNLTKEAGLYISDLLAETVSLELLNIGKNCLSNDFVSTIKDSLTKNTTLTTLGLQSAHLSAKGIETLSSILTFGGNSTLQRIDIRDNKLEVESLTTIAEVLKSNTTITQIDIDDESKRLSVGSDAHLDYARVLENVRSMCSRNEKAQIQMQAERTIANTVGRKRGGYYLGSRKISLTCHGRPIGENINKNVTGGPQISNTKLEVKRKPGTRLRSPVPSPPSVSPSSSPNRASRFQVFRVVEVSPLTSPMGQKTLGGNVTKAASSSSVSIPATEGNYQSQHYPSLSTLSLPTSSSLPSMTTISSSTQSIKRLSISPRSRFQVKKIYEDPMVPLAHRTVPPITTPITPLHASNAVKGTKESTNPKLDINNVELDTKVLHNLPDLVPSSTTSAFSSTFTTTNTYSLPTTSLSLATISPLQYTVAPNAVVNDIKTEQSTNTTITISSNVDAHAETNNIIPSPSTLSSISALSSSSSLSASSSSSISSSSTSPASNVDSSDVSSVASIEAASQQELVASGQCPLAVFSDNDITLTKNTVNEALVNAAAASMIATKESSSLLDNTDAASTSEDNVTPQSTQRVRKVSWISNPTAVDKLLTLFHNPTTIFQRSTSPESKSAPNTQSNPSTTNAAETTLAIQPQTAKSLLPLRKQSPPSWTKLSTDILNATSCGNVEVVNTTVTTASSVVAEQSRSFLDAASKQFRDFSKQVFRQNLSFGNEAITTTLTTTVTTTSVNNIGCSASGLLSSSISATTCTGCPGSIECDAGLIPTDVKQEIKENISPEHTVNEETIHSFQKLCSTTETTEPKDIETAVLDTKDCCAKKGNGGPQEEPPTHNT